MTIEQNDEYVDVGGIRCKSSILSATEARITLGDADLIRVVIESSSAPGAEIFGLVQGQPRTKIGNPNVARSQRAKYASLALAADAVLRARGVDLGCSRYEMVEYAEAFR